MKRFIPTFACALMWGQLQIVYSQNLPDSAMAVLVQAVEVDKCQVLPLGEGYTWEVTADGSPQKPQNYNSDDFQNALYYRGAGIVDIKLTKRHENGINGYFSVRLKVPIDGRIIRKLGNGACVGVFDYTNATTEITKQQEIKGGRTGWTGIIVYATIKGIRCLTPPKPMQQICGRDPSEPWQYRAMYKQKPFDNGWLLVGLDQYSLKNEKFVTKNVEQALMMD